MPSVRCGGVQCMRPELQVEASALQEAVLNYISDWGLGRRWSLVVGRWSFVVGG